MNSTPSPPSASAFQGCVSSEDVVEVMCEDNEGNVTFEIAVVWGVLDNGFEVYFLTRSSEDQLKWVLQDSFTNISWQSVNYHWPLSKYEGSTEEKRKRAFKDCGFRDVGDGFYKVSEENIVHRALPSRETDIGMYDSDSEDTALDSDEEYDDADLEVLDENGDLADFIAPENEVECFTEAKTSFGVSVNHDQIVFDSTEPKNAVQCAMKETVQRIELRARRAEADKRWSRRK